MLPATVSGLSGLGPSSVGAAVKEGAATEDEPGLGCTATLRQHDVAGFEVAVDDSVAMSDSERFGDGDSDLESFIE